jgi:hypothetical protein
MSHTFQFTERVTIGNETTTANNSVTAGQLISIEEAIPDSSTDLLVALSVDVSQIRGVYIESDQALLLETNDGSSPDDTLTLVAGIPYVWYTSKYDALFCIGDDITALYVTNASGETANLKIKLLIDPTV